MLNDLNHTDFECKYYTVQFQLLERQLLEPKGKKSNYWNRFLGFLGQGVKTIIGTLDNYWNFSELLEGHLTRN